MMTTTIAAMTFHAIKKKEKKINGYVNINKKRTTILMLMFKHIVFASRHRPKRTHNISALIFLHNYLVYEQIYSSCALVSHLYVARFFIFFHYFFFISLILLFIMVVLAIHTLTHTHA